VRQGKPKKILPLAKVKEWLAAVDEHARTAQVGTAARLMIGLGLRASEVMGARWEWIDWEARTFTPGRLVDGQFTTKGGEAEPLDLPEWLHDHLLALRGPDPKLGLILPWKTVDGVEFPHPTGFCRASIRAANSDAKTPGVTAHRTRGTWITHLLRQGTPVNEVQKMARHKERETTLDYYEDASEVRKEAQKKLAKGMGLA
jgi:integrase